MRIEMPRDVEWIIGKIRDHGFEAFAVGGCVRDTLLGREPGDWDITTSAKPEEVKGIFGKTVDTGLQHGTVTIIKNRNGYEVTTYRIDGEYHDGRHPESVEFTSNLKEDLKRRDFTINAMAYSHETEIVDEFGGMDDLEHQVIRCVGLAHDRFTEDALRILRAIRFAAQLGFEIEDETYKAISDIAPNLKNVSKERIQVELTKLLLSDYPEKMMMVDATGICPYVTPDFGEAFGKECADSIAKIKTLPKEKSLRWAGFLRHMEPLKVRAILKGLKLDNETIDNGRIMVEAAQTPLIPEKPQIRRFLSKMSRYQFEGCLYLKELDGDSNIEEIRRLWQEIEADGDCISLKMLAVNGGDLMAAGVEKGKILGETLAWLLDLVLEHPELNNKETLLQKLADKISS
ncbi:MAG: CCA tRNA nucleotidyltransferase [Lachnospiraceae bacterium]|nr:CCA tRNA nucleotidyltransferase [Lachnospiraceae bacterium]